MSGFLGFAGGTGPNGHTSSASSGGNSRPTSTTSTLGAVTNYTYNDTASPRTQQATLNNHWTLTTFDGFGRTSASQTGYTSGSTQTTVSTVSTVYAPCGCSPLGKVSQVSQPYQSGTPIYTNYFYDAIGRTTSTVLADSSTTLYSYKEAIRYR